MNRRQLMSGAAAVGGAAALGSLASHRPARAAEPKKGGRLRIGASGGSTTDTLDGATASDTIVMNVNHQLRNHLVEIRAGGEPVPELAESWEATDGAKTWRFKLRQGVEFHNGKTFEADDVVFSINHHRGDKKTNASGITKAIKDVRADGKDTVVFDLEGGNADFAVLMSDYHLPIVPKDTANFDDGIGTGPYMLETWAPGERAVTKRNPNYWKQNSAWFDEVETIVINDTGARMNALMTGDVDAVNQVDLKTIDLMKQRPEIAIYNVAGLKHFSLPMLTDVAPFDNNDARLALKYAFPRAEVLEKVLRGYGTLGNDHPISTANQFHAAGLEQREYDPDKVKFHLKKSGLEGTTFQLHTSDAAFAGAIDASVLYQQAAAKAGLNIELVREPSDAYWDRVWLKAPWCAAFWSGRPTEDFMLSLAYAKGASWNDTHWAHPHFNELLVAARAELDKEKRRAMYYEMQGLIRDEGGALIPIFLNHVSGVSTKVGVPEKQSGDFELDGNRCAERWWFA